jgi:transposase
MGRARVLEEIRIMRFEEVLERHERGSLTQAEAGEMLGMSERTFRRWQVRYREEGVAGLVDGRVGKPSPRRADEGELARARGLYAEMYGGFTAKHFHEKLVACHGYRLGYTVTRLALQGAGLMKRAPRRGAHRRRRPRRPLPGMLLHQDAARHVWLAGRPALDLVVTLDDATSEVNWPPFRPDTRLRQEAWGYPQAQAYVGRLSKDRSHHRCGAPTSLDHRGEAAHRR